MENRIRNIYLKHHYTYELLGNLRFELAHGNSENYENDIEKGKIRGAKLFNVAFKEEKSIQLIFFVSKFDKKINFKRFLHKNKFRIVDSFETTAWFNYYDEPLTVMIIEVPLKNLRLGMLLDGIFYQDFRSIGKLKIKHPIVFYNKNKDIILNIYDDRGADLYTENKKIGSDFFQTYHNWLLDYDLKTMTNYYE